jgi:tryptophan synthase alpha chain
VTPDERLHRLVARSRGFLYAVTVMGVTGERAQLSETAGQLADRIKAITDLPVLLGFGVSTPEQAVQLSEHADGVVVASALMRMVLDGAPVAEVGALAAAMRAALDAAHHP